MFTLNMVKLMQKTIVKSEIGMESCPANMQVGPKNWSDLHVRRSLQHDQSEPRETRGISQFETSGSGVLVMAVFFP